MPQDRKYTFSVQQYSQNGLITIDAECSGITAINVGTTICTINGIPLNPGVPGTSNGDSVSIGGNQNEILTGRINIFFTGGVGSLIIIQKNYIQ